jgi:nitrite reductase/ring-hydroxylating ferredoxin subunit
VHVGAGKAVVPMADGGAVVLTNGWGFAAAARSDHVGLSSNTLTGGGELPTCVVRVRGEVVAQGNQCLHQQAQQPAGILLEASAITASSNRVRGDKSMLILNVNEARFAAVGNLTAGGTRLNGPSGGLPPVWQPLNPTVS